MARKRLPDTPVHGGAMLRKARNYAGVTFPGIAQLLGTDEPGISRIERKRNPEWDTIVAYAQALRMDLPKLVSFATPPTPPWARARKPTRSTTPPSDGGASS